MAKVGFIGLGNMGGGMARNILKAGHMLKVFDLNEQVVSDICAEGAMRAATANDAASDVDAVITMLPAGKHVKAVYLGAEGLIAAANEGTILMDCSTIDVDSARAVAAAASEAGLAMVDAPVSGGVAAAAAGNLTFMVGGPDEAFAAAEPFLDNMGANIIHAGQAGSGQAAKICNNMMLGIQMISVSEAFVLAEKLGLDKQKLYDISSTASGQCWALTSYCPVPGPLPASPANRDYQAGFTVAMMLKDLRPAQQAADASGATTPLGQEAMNLYTQFDGQGKSQLDFSAIVKHIRKD
ncbi:MAG: 3-hydroxyisobutyrate dehydrogenase [Emcibacter sp.]|nr:3-hydroxyisobutyrate dehydrogenase [Emcibacter sp.]